MLITHVYITTYNAVTLTHDIYIGLHLSGSSNFPMVAYMKSTLGVPSVSTEVY